MSHVRMAFGLVLTTCALALAACGGDSGADAPASTSATSLETVKVGILPITDVAPLYLGMKRGYFAGEHLKVEPIPAQGGAAIVPLLLSGEAQFGFGNAISLLIGASKGLPVKIVAQGDQAGSSSGLFVAKDSPIRSPRDLEGKKIGVVTLNNIAGLAVNKAVEDAGGDWRKVQYVELPFPQMTQAIERGDIDGAVAIEPFTTLMAQAGLRKIARPLEQLAPHATIAPYFTTAQYAGEHADVVARFRRAIDKASAYAQAHEQEARAIVPTYTQIPPQVADVMGLPYWSSDLAVETIELQAQLAERYGYVEQAPDVGDLLLEGADGA